MQIASLLEEKGRQVATVEPNRTSRDAVALLASHNIGALVVSTDGRAIEGILSERDVVRSMASLGPETLDQEVGALMSRDVWTCAPTDVVETLMATMTDRRIRHVPVLDDGALIGIVSIGDVVKHRVDELERDRNVLVDYINAR